MGLKWVLGASMSGPWALNDFIRALGFCLELKRSSMAAIRFRVEKVLGSKFCRFRVCGFCSGFEGSVMLSALQYFLVAPEHSREPECGLNRQPKSLKPTISSHRTLHEL